MAIQYVGGQTGLRAGATSAATITFALAGGIDTVPRTGDLVIITVTVGSAARNPACAVTTPAGYTALGLLNNAAQTQDTSLDVSRKFMGTTADTTFDLPSTGNVADAQAYTVQVFRGVNQTTPLDVAVVSANGSGTDRPNPGSITPVTTGAYVVICGGGGSATGANYTGPANYTTGFLTSTSPDTNDVTVGSGFRAWTSGAEDPAAYTGGENVATDSWAAYTIALRPELAFADDSGDAWSSEAGSPFMQNVSVITRRVGLAAGLFAATQAGSVANSWQDEITPHLDETYWEEPFAPRRPTAALPTFVDEELGRATGIGNSSATPSDLWAQRVNAPRISNLYADEVIVAQVTFVPPSDNEPFLFSVRPVVALGAQYQTDDLPIAASQSALDDTDPADFYTVAGKVWGPVPWQFGGGEGSIWAPLDEYYHHGALDPIKKVIPADWQVVDEVIVPQPTAIAVEDFQPQSLVLAVPQRSLLVYDLQDEIVAQPAAVLWPDEWEPFVAKRIVVLPDHGREDEIVPQPTGYGNSGVTAPDLWVAKTNVPQVTYLYSDEGIVAQPTPLSIEDGYWIAPFSIRSPLWTAVAELQDERVTPAVTISVDDDNPLPLIATEDSVWIPAPWQYGMGEGSVWSPLDEQYYHGGLDPLRKAAAFDGQSFADEVVVPPPAPLQIDEQYWNPEVGIVQKPRDVVTVVDEVIVPQPTSIAIDDTAPYPVFTAAPVWWMPVPWQYGAGEGSVWSPLDEDYQYIETPARRIVIADPVISDEVVVPQPAPLQIDEQYWNTEIGIVARPRDVVTVVDEIIVPQPTTIPVDELHWETTVGIVARPRDVVTVVDEVIVPQPTPLQIDEDYWEPLVGKVERPRDVVLLSDEVIVAQPTALSVDDSDADVIVGIVPVKVWMPVPWQYGAGEGSVWSPLDEDYYQQPFSVRPTVCLGFSVEDDVLVQQPIPLQIDEQYWNPEVGLVQKPRDVVTVVDEVIVPQVIRIDEDYWNTAVGIVQKPRDVITVVDEVIVPQPIPLHVDELYWVPGYAVRKMPNVPALLGEDEVLAKHKKKHPKLQENVISRTLTENGQRRSITEKPQSRKLEEE